MPYDLYLHDPSLMLPVMAIVLVGMIVGAAGAVSQYAKQAAILICVALTLFGISLNVYDRTAGESKAKAAESAQGLRCALTNYYGVDIPETTINGLPDLRDGSEGIEFLSPSADTAPDGEARKKYLLEKTENAYTLSVNTPEGYVEADKADNPSTGNCGTTTSDDSTGSMTATSAEFVQVQSNIKDIYGVDVQNDKVKDYLRSLNHWKDRDVSFDFNATPPDADKPTDKEAYRLAHKNNSIILEIRLPDGTYQEAPTQN